MSTVVCESPDVEPDVGSDVGPDVGCDVAGVPDLDGFRGLSGYRRDLAYMTVEREIRRLQALQAAMVTEVESSLSYLDDFHHSPTAWLTAVTNSSKKSAARQVRTAAVLDLLPELAAAVAAGRVGADQVVLLTGLYANDRCRSQLPGSEALLVGYAETLTWSEFRQVCQRWQAHADPDGAHRDHETSRANRHVTTSRVGAGQIIHAEGDALTGEIITNILNAHTDAEYVTDLAERTNRYGDTANQHPLARTHRQRRYDALLTIFLKAARTRETTDRTPLVNIFCTETVLTNAIRNHLHPTPATNPDTDPDPSNRLRLCETAGGAPVDPHDLMIAALIGQIRRVVVDSAGRVIDLGRRQRLFTGAAREAVLLSGDSCSHPGCDIRTGRIDIDHLDAWAAKAGPTNPYNGGPRCPHHNHTKEHGSITVTRDHTGWHHYRPDGTEIAPRTPPTPPASPTRERQ